MTGSREKTVNNARLGGRNTYGHAVVIGSSIAGLTAARVLTDHFSRVTLIDRDLLSPIPGFRSGVPQSRHAHTLPYRGQQILEQQFPGLIDELRARGAIDIAGGSELAFYLGGTWHEVKHQNAIISISCSRPLLEATIYRRLARHPRVRILPQSEVVNLVVGRDKGRVTGVRLRSRYRADADERVLLADLVVDASGRDSRAPLWLEELGFIPPRESTVTSFPGYATRFYRRPADFDGRWKTLFIKPSPSGSSRGGFIIPLEEDRWQVALVGMARDYPPTSEAGFLEFAASLPVPHLYEAIKSALPLSKPYGFRRTESRVRHYEQLPRYLDGFVVLGDAVYTLNPVYAQGMTVAAMASQRLDACLEAQRSLYPAGDLAGLAGRFQQELSRSVAGIWQMVVREDLRWPQARMVENFVPVRPAARKLNPGPKLKQRETSGVFLAPLPVS